MQTHKIINIFFPCIALFGILQACNTTTKEQKYLPDVQKIEANMDIIRFDRLFFSIDTSRLEADLISLKKQHPSFTNGYLKTVLGVGNSLQEPYIVKGYLNFADAKYTYDTVQKVFNNMAQVEKELQDLARHYSYYFPDSTPITKAYAYLSEYHGDRMAQPEDGFVGLPLDMSLGNGYPAYNLLKIPLYDQRTCNKAHLVAKAANAVAQSITARHCQKGGNHLIDQMLYNGKYMYLTDILIPSVADSLKFGYTSYQMEYCRRGELSLYKHLLKNELFYSGDSKLILKYVNKGPFRPEFDLPGNSGTWLGYRMVMAFAKFHKNRLKQSGQYNIREIDQMIIALVMQEIEPQKFLQVYKAAS